MPNITIHRPGARIDDPEAPKHHEIHWTFRATVDGQFGVVTFYAEDTATEAVAAKMAKTILAYDPNQLEGVLSTPIGGAGQGANSGHSSGSDDDGAGDTGASSAAGDNEDGASSGAGAITPATPAVGTNGDDGESSGVVSGLGAPSGDGEGGEAGEGASSGAGEGSGSDGGDAGSVGDGDGGESGGGEGSSDGAGGTLKGVHLPPINLPE